MADGDAPKDDELTDGSDWTYRLMSLERIQADEIDDDGQDIFEAKFQVDGPDANAEIEIIVSDFTDDPFCGRPDLDPVGAIFVRRGPAWRPWVGILHLQIEPVYALRHSTAAGCQRLDAAGEVDQRGVGNYRGFPGSWHVHRQRGSDAGREAQRRGRGAPEGRAACQGGALLDQSGALLDVVDLPTLDAGPACRPEISPHLFAAIVRRWSPARAWVEWIGPRQVDRPAGAFSFGASKATVETALAVLGVPFRTITPATWKRAAGIPGWEGAQGSRPGQGHRAVAGAR